MPVNTFNQIPRRKVPFEVFEIVRAKPGSPLIGYMVGPYYWGLWTHYEVTTQPCTKDEGHCKYCERKMGRRWYGYMPFLRARTTKPVIVSMPLMAAEQIEKFKASGEKLSNRTITFKKATANHSSKTLVSFDPLPHPKPSIPDPFNPLYSVYLMMTNDPDRAMNWGRQAESKLLQCEREHRAQNPDLYVDTPEICN